MSSQAAPMSQMPKIPPLSAIPDDVAADTLLASLVILAKLHGARISPAMFMEAAGTPHAALTAAAAVHALQAHAFRCSWVGARAELIKTSFCPMIALLQGEVRRHVVITEVRDRHASVVDPITQASSTIALDQLRVDDLLVAAPPPLESDRADMVVQLQGARWLWGSLWRFRRSFAEAIFLTVVINVLVLAMSVLTMSVYDRVLPNQAYTTLWALSIGACIAVFFEFVTRTWRAAVLDKVGKKVDLLLGSLVFRHVMMMRLENQQGQSAGSFAHVIREYESIRDFVTSLTLNVLADLPFLVLFIWVIAYIAGPLAWVPVVGVIVMLVVLAAAQLPLSRLLAESLRQTAVRSGLIVEALVSLDALKSLRAESIIVRQHDRIADQSASLAMRTRVITTLVMNLSVTVQQLCTVVILLWGVYLVGESKATAGALVATVMLLGRAMQPLSSLASLATRFQQARNSLLTLNKIMKRPLEREPGASYFHRPRWEGALQSNRLTFKYQPQLANVLDGIDLTIRPGERVAIIGRMGSGKSTLLKLLAGLYRPSSGEVVLDGLDLRHVDIADVRRSVRMLTQEVRLMHGSLLDNLRLASPHASDDAILEAARVTGVMEFATRHPLGLNMPVGEGGKMLSGGQRQAVALAQVMLGDARVMLLDEPTASMDQVSEQAIHKALARVSEGRTLVLVTHKTSLLALVDRLIVLDQGRVILDGPKDQVIRQLATNAATGHKPVPVSPPGAPERDMATVEI
jgi:ATP-binding cassette subfamily C protein LapB